MFNSNLKSRILVTPWIAWISDVSTILGDSSTTGTYPEYGKINLKISRFDNKTYSETALHLSLANQNFMLWSPISYSLQIVWQLINVCLFHLLVQKVFFLSSNFFEHVQYFLIMVKSKILPYKFTYLSMVKNIWTH